MARRAFTDKEITDYKQLYEDLLAECSQLVADTTKLKKSYCELMNVILGTADLWFGSHKNGLHLDTREIRQYVEKTEPELYQKRLNELESQCAYAR